MERQQGRSSLDVPLIRNRRDDPDSKQKKCHTEHRNRHRSSPLSRSTFQRSEQPICPVGQLRVPGMAVEKLEGKRERNCKRARVTISDEQRVWVDCSGMCSEYCLQSG